MDLLPHKTYRLLKKIEILQKADVNELAKKFGKTTETRIDNLYDSGYIRYSKHNSDVLFITQNGKAYLEDYKHFVCSEFRTSLKNSVIYPLIVAFITSVVTNAWLS